MNNPFSIYFGKTPEQFISRLNQTNDILECFGADVPSSQVFMITGIRGCGKTVMMTDLDLSALGFGLSIEGVPPVTDIENALDKMAACTRGYSYAFQVLGYLMWRSKSRKLEDILDEYDQYLDEYVYSKIWSELSKVDKKIICQMAKSHDTNVTVIRKELGMSTPEFSVYRDRLKRKGLINSTGYGSIALTLPRFEEYSLRKNEY